MPVYTLLNISYRVCSSYPAVKNYENRQYPQFFHNRETLREAITEAWRIGDWKQKKIIVLTIEAACSESMTIKTSDSEVLAAPPVAKRYCKGCRKIGWEMALMIF